MDKSSFLSFISHQYLQYFLLLKVSLLLGFACGMPEPEEYQTYVTHMDQASPEDYQTYIIHMDHAHKPDSFSTHESWHHHTVSSLLAAAADDQKALVYSYNHVMHGFSARLTPSQLAQLESSPAHRATFKDSVGKLLTTRTPKFLGLNRRSGIWPDSLYGKDVIIGVIDSGIWPESESFNDKGMQPVPKRWKGLCENGVAFSQSLCNNKIIGARSYSRGYVADGRIIDEFEYNSTRDYNGHGSHVASIAAGSQVLGVSHFGYASGTAGGVAPAAHIAIYKAMWSRGGEGVASDILAAMDQAIADGVDILNLSLQNGQTPYFENVVAIGALSAIERGIVVIGGAGNDGPESGTVVNGAPWFTTVGAGTVDRTFTAELKLGNGLTIEGRSYFPQSVYITNASLHYDISNFEKRICNSSALDPEEVSGKVVLCDSSNGTNLLAQILEVRRVRAIAGIFISDQIITPFGYVIPSVALPTKYGPKVREYAMSQNPRPTVKSMKFVITRSGQTQAPKVARLSSRGPDPVGHGILKPDILAPGFEILAAISPVRIIMNVGNYSLVTDYRLDSGTSMATPHIAGVAALVKAVHPDWSPAAVRSALMTTANTVDNKKSQIQDQLTGLLATPLDFGAGHVDPNKAMNPGLVYDISFEDYVEFICGVGYSKTQISALLRRNEWKCSENQTDLNYPSFYAEFFERGKSIQGKTFKRTVTNVGNDITTYTAVLVVPNGMRIRVEPSTMTFTRKYQKQSFTLSVEIDEDSPSINYGFLKWIDQHNHVVSSPVVALNS